MASIDDAARAGLAPVAAAAAEAASWGGAYLVVLMQRASDKAPNVRAKALAGLTAVFALEKDDAELDLTLSDSDEESDENCRGRRLRRRLTPKRVAQRSSELRSRSRRAAAIPKSPSFAEEQRNDSDSDSDSDSDFDSDSDSD
mgnify:CR=1 FL=1